MQAVDAFDEANGSGLLVESPIKHLEAGEKTRDSSYAVVAKRLSFINTQRR